MQSSKENISIKRKNFGKNSSIILLGFATVFFIFGTILSLYNLKEALYAISIIAVLYLGLKKDYIKLPLIVLIPILLAVAFSYILNLNFLLIIAITALLAFSFFIMVPYVSKEKNGEFEIFFLDNKN